MRFKKGQIPWNKGLHIYLGGKRFEKGLIPWNKGEKKEKKCESCNKIFLIYPYREKASRFCNHFCYGKWRKTIKLSEEHKKNIAKAGIGKHTQSPNFETRKKMSIAKTGILIGEWKEFSKTGRQRAMQQKDYVLWRTAVFMRDDYTCQECNVRGGELNADHIKPWALYPDLRYAIDNGRTLCVVCHRQTDT